MPRKFNIRWRRLDVKTFVELVSSHREFDYFDPRRHGEVCKIAGSKSDMKRIFRVLPRAEGKRLMGLYMLYKPGKALQFKGAILNDPTFTYIVKQIRNVEEGSQVYAMPAS